MKCRCGGDTFVVDSRNSEFNSIRRRRQCEVCDRRVTTYETVRKPTAQIYEKKNPGRIKAWKLANPEKVRRYKLRERARQEAAEKGRPVAEIYKEWGCE